MRYGLSVMNFGDLAEARRMADLARAAEAAGWEALLVWDHLAFVWGQPAGDAWTLVTATALATERLLVGTDVAVLPRERPWAFANRLATIDRLSGGRVVCGIGLGGVAREFAAFGEPDGLRERAATTDEGLAIVDALWRGGTVTHAGPRFTVDGVTLAPLPVQRPRIPVWIGGASVGARRRAARWDGWVPVTVDDEGNQTLSPEGLASGVAAIAGLRAAAGIDPAAPFEVVLHGDTSGPGPEGRAEVRTWAEAGATWWLESLHQWRGSTGDLFARVAAGPPR